MIRIPIALRKKLLVRISGGLHFYPQDKTTIMKNFKGTIIFYHLENFFIRANSYRGGL